MLPCTFSSSTTSFISISPLTTVATLSVLIYLLSKNPSDISPALITPSHATPLGTGRREFRDTADIPYLHTQYRGVVPRERPSISDDRATIIGEKKYLIPPNSYQTINQSPANLLQTCSRFIASFSLRACVLCCQWSSAHCEILGCRKSSSKVVDLKGLVTQDNVVLKCRKRDLYWDNSGIVV